MDELRVFGLLEKWTKWTHVKWRENGIQVYPRLKHRRFWVTDGNRKANVLVLGALSPAPAPMTWKALVLAFITWGYGRKVAISRWYAPKTRTFDFRWPSVTQKRLFWRTRLLAKLNSIAPSLFPHMVWNFSYADFVHCFYSLPCGIFVYELSSDIHGY